MAMLQRGQATVGPVAIDGRTVTLVSRTHALKLGRRGSEIPVWSGPHHVEVLDRDGRRNVVRMHDLERVAFVAIAATTIVGAALVRAARARRSTA